MPPFLASRRVEHCNCKPRIFLRASRKFYERLIPQAKAYKCRKCGYRFLEIPWLFGSAQVAAEDTSSDPIASD
jgi:hypothetical protein